MNDTEALEAIVATVLASNPDQVEQYANGKVALFGFFVGQCMKESKGQGNPKIFTDLLKKRIGG